MKGRVWAAGNGGESACEALENKEVDSGRASFVTLQGFGDAEMAACI
jgi:hypothetical protein